MRSTVEVKETRDDVFLADWQNPRGKVHRDCPLGLPVVVVAVTCGSAVRLGDDGGLLARLRLGSPVREQEAPGGDLPA